MCAEQRRFSYEQEIAHLEYEVSRMQDINSVGLARRVIRILEQEQDRVMSINRTPSHTPSQTLYAMPVVVVRSNNVSVGSSSLNDSTSFQNLFRDLRRTVIERSAAVEAPLITIMVRGAAMEQIEERAALSVKRGKRARITRSNTRQHGERRGRKAGAKRGRRRRRRTREEEEDTNYGSDHSNWSDENDCSDFDDDSGDEDDWIGNVVVDDESEEEMEGNSTVLDLPIMSRNDPLLQALVTDRKVAVFLDPTRYKLANMNDILKNLLRQQLPLPQSTSAIKWPRYLSISDLRKWYDKFTADVDKQRKRRSTQFIGRTKPLLVLFWAQVDVMKSPVIQSWIHTCGELWRTDAIPILNILEASRQDTIDTIFNRTVR